MEEVALQMLPCNNILQQVKHLHLISTSLTPLLTQVISNTCQAILMTLITSLLLKLMEFQLIFFFLPLLLTQMSLSTLIKSQRKDKVVSLRDQPNQLTTRFDKKIS